MRALRSSVLPAVARLAPVLLTAALLAGCGGGSSSGQSAAARERAEEARAEATFQQYARCLRAHGIQVEVRSSPGEGHGLKVNLGEAANGPAKMEAAERSCARYRPEPKQIDLSPQQKVEREEAVQKFARCMREHGVKVNASAKGGGIQIQVGPAGPDGPGGPNPRSPVFQEAQSACQKLLPGGGPGHGHQASGPGSVKADG